MTVGERTLRVLEAVSDAGASHNDDWWDHAANAAWILDGATGLSHETLFPRASSDAAWFVSAISDALKGSASSTPLSQSLKAACRIVERRFLSEATNLPSDPVHYPSASLAALQLSNSTVEMLNLGDCRLLWREAAGSEVFTFGSSAVPALDHRVVSEIKRLHANGVTDKNEIWSRVVPIIHANRRLINKPEGYWILNVTGDGLTHVQRETMNCRIGQRYLLLTDGFYRLVDTYGNCADHALFDTAINKGLIYLLDQLRSIERNDPEGIMFPRIKPSDDATAVLLEAV
jgi:hypothetical protein